MLLRVVVGVVVGVVEGVVVGVVEGVVVGGGVGGGVARPYQTARPGGGDCAVCATTTRRARMALPPNPSSHNPADTPSAHPLHTHALHLHTPSPHAPAHAPQVYELEELFGRRLGVWTRVIAYQWLFQDRGAYMAAWPRVFFSQAP